MIADAQGLIGAYLRAHPDVVALQARVAVKVAKSNTEPWVKITQLGAGDRSAGSDHLISFLLQFDCYASAGVGGGNDRGSVEADLLGRVVRGALRQITPDDVPGWTPSIVAINGPRNLGVDTDLEPARDRTLVDAEILLHPVVGS